MANKIYPVRKNNRYYFDLSHKPESVLFHTIPSFFKSLIGRTNPVLGSIDQWLEQCDPIQSSIEPAITWIGHASFLIQIGGINILMDPIFGSPSLFFPRILPAGIPGNQLPKIDFVLISHNHPDHMDYASLKLLKSHGAQLYVPKGDKYRLNKIGLQDVKEFDWWQEVNFIDFNRCINKLRIAFLPAAHWSARGLFDKNKSLWGGWLIEVNNYRIFFAGDSAYAHHFKNIADELPGCDIAMLPIGPCEPHESMKHTHMNPQQAINAFLDVQAEHFIPMHWGTFPFGLDYFDVPIIQLKTGWQALQDQLATKKLHVLKVGQRLVINYNLD